MDREYQRYERWSSAMHSMAGFPSDGRGKRGAGGGVRDAKHRWLGFLVMVEGKGGGWGVRDAKHRWLDFLLLERGCGGLVGGSPG